MTASRGRPPGRNPRRPDRGAGRPAPRGERERPLRSQHAELGGDRVEGRQAVRELLLAGRRRVAQIAVSETATGEAVEEIIALAREAGVPLRRMARAQIDAAAVTEAPQGIVATADPVQPVEFEDLLEGGEGPPLLVVLDGVTDPHNLGAVMRSALCAGATGLVLGRHRSAHLTPAAVKAAAGAVEHLPIALVGGIPAALAQLTGAGVWTAGLDASATTGLWDLAVADQPVALVLGAEGVGLSRLAAQRCEVLVRIPMSGPLASLNVSATAAIACFEVARRRAGR